jgi:hypothetical protein
MEYKYNDGIYKYSVIYSKIKNTYELYFDKYKDSQTIAEQLLLVPSNNDMPQFGRYYSWYYRNGNEAYDQYKLLYPVLDKSIDYFYNIIYCETPNKVISDKLILDGGFSINEETYYGFIYSRKLKNNTARYADKYGLKNTNEIDYNKFLCNYTITDNGLLLVKNRFMESYNYIATKKEYGLIMTQESFIKSSIPYNIIYLSDNIPTSIKIGNNKETKYSIEAKYSDLGITTSLIVNNEEKCQYEIDDINGIITSIHPLVYEPFYTPLYKNIILDDLPYDVMEEYEETDEYIEYTRTVFKK